MMLLIVEEERMESLRVFRIGDMIILFVYCLE